MMLEALPRPAILAHRGASAFAPENTLAAFELALAQGADGIELDVTLSADGRVVVIHDATVERTTGARGRVRDLSLADLRALDAGSLFGESEEKFRGEKIPTLEEVFEALGGRTFINIELKPYTAPRNPLVENVCTLVKKFNLQESVLFSSFFASNLARARTYLPEVASGLLALNGLLGAWARSFGFVFGAYQALHPNLKDATRQQIQRVHRLNRRIHVYTVNAAKDMRRLFNWGVDGIFTDDPMLAVQVRGESK
ncbi:MAG: glycerophosphodiester phosphodiesterase [Candidatus Binatia bacterium]